MRIRSLTTRLAVPLAAFGLILTGCSDNGAIAPGTSTIGSTNDINPVDPSQLREGGNLRLVLSSFPENFNVLQVDGGTESGALVAGPTMPAPFVSNAAGELSVDHNFFTDVQLTNTSPQQVTYTINPKAVWSDGSPITWEDLRSQANAQSGKDNAYLVSALSGFDRVEKVERGVDDRQAIVTFSQPYGEWRGQFSPLYPKSVTGSPEAFNTANRDGLTLSSGPFVISNIDRAQQRITLSRNPQWWGDTPKLDNITFSVLDHTAWLPAIQNNELDIAYMSGIENVTAARYAANVVIRRAPEPSWSHLTFNGAPGSLLEDPQLRIAISKAIDRQGIVTASQNGVVENPKPLNNHIFMAGQKGYQDNAAPIAYDPAEAARMLDELGWKLNGDVREKDGRRLELRDVMYQQDAWVQTAQIVQQNLAAVGVKLNIQTVPGTGLFKDVIDPGNFDIAQFSWGGSALPLGALQQVYYYDPNNLMGNKARIGSPELNALIDKTIAELDPDKAIELANQCDQMIFAEGYSVPLHQASGTYAVRDNLANYGAFGLATPDYTKVGFLK
ncbi:ABC transporter family substrate-binding protein [Nocardia bhagyanarayanae]|uniref:Peptide/nickel transport system substrate-binding protein n=1 Tax=Nocardia bhagyanarayanae TaxID=1215925 RepID=A0A543F6K9_9NOCA|nr:ABC transporter family substrate-binding protein [Nocardia bhagyanarayanae]TQM29468.1 peptide/nickel transport system substrate-binding protein [Nocardia bhagyanarayanae]